MERNPIGHYLDNDINENFRNEIKELNVLSTINLIEKVTSERDKLYSEICEIKNHDDIGHLKPNFMDNDIYINNTNQLRHDTNELGLKSVIYNEINELNNQMNIYGSIAKNNKYNNGNYRNLSSNMEYFA